MDFDIKDFLQRLGNPKATAIAFFNKYDDKLKPYFDDNNDALCEVIKKASEGKLIAKNLDKLDKCTIGTYVLGHKELPDDLVDRWVKNVKLEEKTTHKMLGEMNCFKKQIAKYVLMGPLTTFMELSIEPNTAIFLVDSDQIHILNVSYFDITGENIVSSFNGHASCQIIPATILRKKPWIAFPCMGSRTLAKSDKNEIWFGAGMEDVKKIYERMKISGLKYPLSAKSEVLLKVLSRDIEDM